MSLREAEEFKQQESTVNCLFSTSDIQDLFIHAASYLTKKTGDVKMHKEYLQFTAKVVNAEIQKVDPQSTEKIIFTIKIMTVEDSDKICIKFIKNKGDLFAFNKLFKEAKTFFAGYVNTHL